MKVLLEFSRGGLPEHGPIFALLRQQLLAAGHTLTNDLLQDSNDQIDPLPDDIYHRLQRAIAEAQCVIVEGSVVSLSIGFVLTEAIERGKPVLFLMSANSVTQRNRFIKSVRSKLVTHKTYATEAEALRHLKLFLVHHQAIKTRFNLVLPNDLNSYVTIQSQKRGISKTEYITELIETSRQDA